jgi:hypothetical protein
MKKLILSAIACFVIVLSSCNQNSPTPAPATPATPTPTPTPTSSMTATEAALVGDWIWDKTESYTSGNLTSIVTPSTTQGGTGAPTSYTVFAGSHMVLKSSFYNNTATTYSFVPQQYNADYYSYYSLSNSWQVSTNPNGPKLTTPHSVLGGGYIITLNSTNLIVQAWLPGQIPNGGKLFYHK